MKYSEATMIVHVRKGVWQAEDRLYYEGHENVSLVDMPRLGVEVPAGWCCKMAVVEEALQSTVLRKNGPCVGEQSRQVKLCDSTLVQCAVESGWYM
jgi:phosphoenolpyruvate synthase/pyruvate phosphate dikinase